MLSHSHFCKHCDKTWTCDNCSKTEWYDIRDASRVHDCWQRKYFAHQMRAALSDPTHETPYPQPTMLDYRMINGTVILDGRDKLEVQRAKDKIVIPDHPIFDINPKTQKPSLNKHSDICICKKCRRSFEDQLAAEK